MKNKANDLLRKTLEEALKLPLDSLDKVDPTQIQKLSKTNDIVIGEDDQTFNGIQKNQFEYNGASYECKTGVTGPATVSYFKDGNPVDKAQWMAAYQSVALKEDINEHNILPPEEVKPGMQAYMDDQPVGEVLEIVKADEIAFNTDKFDEFARWDSGGFFDGMWYDVVGPDEYIVAIDLKQGNKFDCVVFSYGEHGAYVPKDGIHHGSKPPGADERPGDVGGDSHSQEREPAFRRVREEEAIGEIVLEKNNFIDADKDWRDDFAELWRQADPKILAMIADKIGYPKAAISGTHPADIKDDYAFAFYQYLAPEGGEGQEYDASEEFLLPIAILNPKYLPKAILSLPRSVIEKILNTITNLYFKREGAEEDRKEIPQSYYDGVNKLETYIVEQLNKAGISAEAIEGDDGWIAIQLNASGQLNEEEAKVFDGATPEQETTIYDLKNWAAEKDIDIGAGEETVNDIIKFGFQGTENWVTILISPMGDIKISGHAVKNFDDFSDLIDFFTQE